MSAATFTASKDFTPDYELHLIPYQAVDKLLEEDYASHGDGAYTVYLLNPPSHAPYAYNYQAAGK